MTCSAVIVRNLPCAFIDAADTLRVLLNSDLNEIHRISKIAGKGITESLIEN